MPAAAPIPVCPGSDAHVHRQAHLLAQYLVGESPTPEIAERYARAVAIHTPGPHSVQDSHVLSLATRRPWTLPFLDGASAMMRPAGLLRKRVLIMAAILEATPRGSRWFLPSSVSVGTLALLLARCGMLHALHLAIGAPLIWIAERRHR